MPQNQQNVTELSDACDALKSHMDACEAQFSAQGSISQANLDELNARLKAALAKHSQLVS